MEEGIGLFNGIFIEVTLVYAVILELRFDRVGAMILLLDLA